MELPTEYHKLSIKEKAMARHQYIEEQNNKCWFCNCDIYKDPPKSITERKINWYLFPKGFLDHPIHLQHNHDTGMTEGAVHAYCNAVLWQYFGR